MSDRNQRIEALHQTASAHYLQGNTAGALAAWRELLTLCPDDERAHEGIRLCEMLAEDAEPSFAVPEATDTDRPVGAQQPPPAPEAAPAPSPAAAPTDSFEFDFSEVEAEPSSTELEPIPPSAAVAQGSTEAGEAAAEELANRANELLAEATMAYEQGRRDDAVGLIKRVFILDDDNSAARSLQEIIDAEVESEQAADPGQPLDPSPIAPSGAGDDVLELDLSTTAKESLPESPSSPEAPLPETSAAAGAMPETLDPPLDEPGGLPDDLDDPLGEDEDDLEIEVEGLAEPLPIPVKKKSTLPTWALIAAGLIVAVAVGAYFASGMLGDDSLTAPTAEELMPTPAPDLPADVLPPADEVAVAHSPEEVEQVTAFLAQAESAFERGDYAAAVLVLGRAIEIDPANPEATRRLEEAGELYRAQKERDRKWQEAIDSFNQGAYRSALTILYRLPADSEEETAILAGYRRNAWYNMGLQALKSSDCKGALSHLNEALALDGADPEVAAAIELAHRCNDGDRAFYSELDNLNERGLED